MVTLVTLEFAKLNRGGPRNDVTIILYFIKNRPVPFRGSDDEAAICAGIPQGESFKSSQQLLCTIHAKENCEGSCH